MKLNTKRGPGRPPTGKVLVGFKLSPELAKAVRKTAAREKRKISDLAEEILRTHLLPPRADNK
jgi:hypothetical protein